MEFLYLVILSFSAITNYCQNKKVHEQGQNVLKEQMGFVIYKCTWAKGFEWNKKKTTEMALEKLAN